MGEWPDEKKNVASPQLVSMQVSAQFGSSRSGESIHKQPECPSLAYQKTTEICSFFFFSVS